MECIARYDAAAQDLPSQCTRLSQHTSSYACQRGCRPLCLCRGIVQLRSTFKAQLQDQCLDALEAQERCRGDDRHFHSRQVGLDDALSMCSLIDVSIAAVATLALCCDTEQQGAG